VNRVATAQSASQTPRRKKIAGPIGHYLGGHPVHSSGGGELAIHSPVDGSPIGVLGMANVELVGRAVATALAAAEKWASTPVKQRVQSLLKFKQIVERDLDDLAARITRENGKTHAEARAEIEKGIEVVEYAASAPILLAGEMLEVSSGVDCHTRRYPLGVVAGITPFNFPAMVPMWMFPIAIACGNTFILKPSEQVPTTPLRLAELLAEAGLPDGVFNVVQGDKQAVEAILDHPQIQAVTFVGSTPVARAIFRRGSDSGKRVLALGGAKNHLLVMPDADVELTAQNVVASATGCAGQRCMAASVLIAVGDCQKILAEIEDRMRQIRPGRDMGAIISAKARDRIVSYIDQAQRDGAEVRVDGRGAVVEGKSKGIYVGPTLLDGLSPQSRCVSDEIFGPVLSVLRVKNLDQALGIENASPYGNAASIYTSSGAAARVFEQRAHAGMIGINVGVPVPREPMGFGGWNQSRFGSGDITGRDAFAFWTRAKKTTTKWTNEGKRNWMS
jgi:malonate-semialdehyde dehydrogenase (acetylating) / methylmalonate-semialdehyde dehydrogenase